MSTFATASLSTDTIAMIESLAVMLQKEETVYEKTRDYLQLQIMPRPELDRTMIKESDRTKIVNWCFSMIDHFELDRENVSVAMEIVDRFMSNKANSITATVQDIIYDRVKFQLLAMAALYISIKINERVAYSSHLFADLSNGTYSVDKIENMEFHILQGLSWRINSPTSIQMARHILSVILLHVNIEESTEAFILDEVQLQTECAVKDHFFSMQRASTVAMAAIFNAVDQINVPDREAILSAQVLLLNEGSFASPAELLDATYRLKCLVEENEISDEETVHPGLPTICEDCSVDRETEEICRNEQISYHIMVRRFSF